VEELCCRIERTHGEFMKKSIRCEKRAWCKIVVLAALLTSAVFDSKGSDGSVQLPRPRTSSEVSVEEAISRKKSIRRYRDSELTLKEVSQLLWACGGKAADSVTSATRTYPSAGGVYPLEMYIVVGEVESLDPGVYRYIFEDHTVQLLDRGDFRQNLAQAAVGQRFVRDAPMSIILTAQIKKIERVYGERGATRYVHMEAGHAAQNVYLQAEAFGLATVAVGAFIDEKVLKLLDIEGVAPLYIMPVGRPK
jgi:SagB-type dehydrogenase family enzyme